MNCCIFFNSIYCIDFYLIFILVRSLVSFVIFFGLFDIVIINLMSRLFVVRFRFITRFRVVVLMFLLYKVIIILEVKSKIKKNRLKELCSFKKIIL